MQIQEEKAFSNYQSTQMDPFAQKYFLHKATPQNTLDDYEIASSQPVMTHPTSTVTATLLQKVQQLETRIKHTEGTLKLQDDLFRLKKEEHNMSDRIEKQTYEQVEQKQNDLVAKINKLETIVDQI